MLVYSIGGQINHCTILEFALDVCALLCVYVYDTDASVANSLKIFLKWIRLVAFENFQLFHISIFRSPLVRIPKLSWKLFVSYL